MAQGLLLTMNGRQPCADVRSIHAIARAFDKSSVGEEVFMYTLPNLMPRLKMTST